MKDDVFHDGSADVISAYDPLIYSMLPAAKSVTSTGVSSPRNGVRPFLAIQGRQKSWYKQYGKRVLDLAFILMTLPISLPIVALCAIALWIEGGQPFYWQDRLGERGRRFRIVKLRTMSRNADAELETYLASDPALRREWDTTQKLKNDPRITRVGAILRSTSLDELPQLWNVAKGDMSVVGPRPMMPEQLSLYANPLPYFDLRPGITGQWQVSDRNENSFAHRSTVDASYWKCLSFVVDLKILFQTVGVVLRRTGY